MQAAKGEEQHFFQRWTWVMKYREKERETEIETERDRERQREVSMYIPSSTALVITIISA